MYTCVADPTWALVLPQLWHASHTFFNVIALSIICSQSLGTLQAGLMCVSDQNCAWHMHTQMYTCVTNPNWAQVLPQLLQASHSFFYCNHTHFNNMLTEFEHLAGKSGVCGVPKLCLTNAYTDVYLWQTPLEPKCSHSSGMLPKASFIAICILCYNMLTECGHLSGRYDVCQWPELCLTYAYTDVHMWQTSLEPKFSHRSGMLPRAFSMQL